MGTEVVSAKLAFIRCIIQPRDDSLQGQVDLLRSWVKPLRRTIGHQSYASRQGSHLWLTVVARDSDCNRLERSVRFGGLNATVERSEERDPLLDAAASWYRDRLHETTSIALDLLTEGNLAAHQRYLIEAACAVPQPAVAELKRKVVEFSPTYTGWSPAQQDSYWSDFYRPGPHAGMSYPGHWLWNLVSGWHPRCQENPAPYLRALGLAG